MRATKKKRMCRGFSVQRTTPKCRLGCLTGVWATSAPRWCMRSRATRRFTTMLHHNAEHSFDRQPSTCLGMSIHHADLDRGVAQKCVEITCSQYVSRSYLPASSSHVSSEPLFQ